MDSFPIPNANIFFCLHLCDISYLIKILSKNWLKSRIFVNSFYPQLHSITKSNHTRPIHVQSLSLVCLCALFLKIDLSILVKLYKNISSDFGFSSETSNDISSVFGCINFRLVFDVRVAITSKLVKSHLFDFTC